MSNSRTPLSSLGPREAVGKCSVTRAWALGLAGRSQNHREGTGPELGPRSLGLNDWSWNHRADVEMGEIPRLLSGPPSLCHCLLLVGSIQKPEQRSLAIYRGGKGGWGIDLTTSRQMISGGNTKKCCFFPPWKLLLLALFVF